MLICVMLRVISNIQVECKREKKLIFFGLCFSQEDTFIYYKQSGLNSSCGTSTNCFTKTTKQAERPHEERTERPRTSTNKQQNKRNVHELFHKNNLIFWGQKK